MKIRAKILLVTLPISLAILAVSFGMTFYTSRAALRSVAYSDLKSKAKEAARIPATIRQRVEGYNMALSASGATVRVDTHQVTAETVTEIAKIQVGKSGGVISIGTDGVLLGHREKKLIGLNVSEQPWYQQILKNPDEVAVFTLDGTEYLGAALKEEGWGWHVIAAQPSSEIYGAVQESDRHVLIIVCIGALFLIASIVAFSSRISGPLQELCRGVEAIGHGKLDTRIRALGKDELGDLALAFNEMSGRLQSSIRDQERTSQALKELNESLEIKVKERTQELHSAQKAAVDNAHAAGMAEIATGVLHNVGNILNSANVSVEQMSTIVAKTGIKGLLKANELLKSNLNDLPKFFGSDPRGKSLAEYYLKIEEVLQKESVELKSELERTRTQIGLIKAVITTQQTYAKTGLGMEDASLVETIEEFLYLEQVKFDKHKVQIHRDFTDVPNVRIQKVKLAHILFNLVKNAVEAMDSKPPEERWLKFQIGKSPQGQAFIKITDNGAGISAANLTRVFSHGFTTRKDGHGFGLHYCANAMVEMGGKLTVESPGEGQGASFTAFFAPSESKAADIAS